MNLKISALILLLITMPCVFAATPKGDGEAKRAAEEEAAEKSLNGEDSRKTPILYGKVSMTPPDPDKKDVVGTFTVGAQQYLLKLEKEDLRAAVAKYDGKEVSLQGKIRNDGKYFIVMSIFGGAGAPPVQLRNPEGL
jgi:hypothetical protein